ncbi:hypothetical protein [Deinococcus radiodurans]|jgi:hypothetical protein|uniref:Uncharacterized protein n=1 Tax=Deinococcus radiodurans (strain ATCC 13939 / DSM 20539 / JCM 16871 / CCUG 27074 / LMG 4051 / NBRC 15346 / NCIMB 9279 / VKM B-1422 / R1) TaxID=243230 RepID=Q9RZ74_DEIRA|nr:hypothetical protein [Deinococcus radiodurans]AAF12348.1 hypothetical protein DR_A0080 [Deinococcus radiodurans R1 = ATCC 13939 = DSM 20539]ANC72940.1 hypothetical protein A2G07_13890 [Deinococcus radiodurans R1 = ATCC 13939 = DSM 20539]QEM72898.1 hypothetical protein DXG80_13860 [Deinococcus radiodurans]QIP30423.1 hypothetical protein HAV23_14315 [Deinococcus radiodurans]QIP33218.1 hypothetical protein HAV35_13675 [Deinococcus radiodurans]
MSGPDTVTTVEEARAAGLLSGPTVEQAMDRAVLLGEDSGEITLYRDCEWWHAYPVGGPWSCTDNVPNASAHSPRLALDLLLALPAFPTEEPA